MKDKVVWITGASSGIGEALVYRYHQEGAKLIISSRNRDELFRVKANCKNAINIHVLSLDLEQTETLPQKAQEALRIFGKIDLLINSGGISQRSLALATATETEEKIMRVNFWETVTLSKAVIPGMIEKGGGQIVCISSLTGKFGTRFRSAYAASKHALHGYFDSLRAEIADQKIDITLVCPGFIKTNVSLHALKGNGEAQNVMDDSINNGMPVADCAAKIYKAVSTKKQEVYIGGKEVKGVLFKRLFPLRFSKYMKTAKVT
ncbi:dehydrogenase/reductase SDR family protein 7B [Pedobacter sp. CG_S7]|uniref:SDR family oxidoreductase n=1 Tax=Pedobacter sp. CG_S7 TaxID=3143930 RepID=UPI0033987116